MMKQKYFSLIFIVVVACMFIYMRYEQSILKSQIDTLDREAYYFDEKIEEFGRRIDELEKKFGI